MGFFHELAMEQSRRRKAPPVVEGKVDESFGERVSVWLADAPSRKPLRLARLCRTLNLSASDVHELRYQLLHRTASAVYEAIRYRAKHAAMIVHSFDPGHAGLADFLAFADAMKIPGAGANKIAGPIKCAGVDLYLGWVADRVPGATAQYPNIAAAARP
jgi:hypothetical protein